MKFGAALVLLAFFMFPIISAVGVATSYWDDKPLKLAPGESTTISLRLQNEDEKQITMQATLNSEMAALVDGPKYDVPPGRVSVPVYIKISIPQSAEIGTKYNIPVSFQQVSSIEGEGLFQVSQGITSKIPVEVVSSGNSELYGAKPKANYLLIAGVIAAVAALSLLIYYFRKKGKKSSGK